MIINSLICSWSPVDPNVFATACLDGIIRVWNINGTLNYGLQGHTKGVNWVEWYQGGDKPYLVSGSDDTTVIVWDYQSKAQVQKLTSHSHNVTSCCFHPRLPLIITGAEDHVVSIYHSQTFQLLETLNYGLDRVWTFGVLPNTTDLAIGYDFGVVVVKLGKQSWSCSMDKKGKVIVSEGGEVWGGSIEKSGGVWTSGKELGNVDVYPRHLEHDSKGRFVSLVGDGEYVIYAAISWRSKTYGQADEFVWGPGSGQYCIKEKGGQLKVFKEFKETKAWKPFFTPTQIFGGNLISAKGDEFICLFDWETCQLIRSIDIVPHDIIWSDNGEYVALCCQDQFFILRFNAAILKQALAQGAIPEEGLPAALDVITEPIGDKVKHGQFIGDVFLYVTSEHHCKYFLGGDVQFLHHIEKGYRFLGYVAKQNKVYFMNQKRNIHAIELNMNVLRYQTAIVRGDIQTATALMENGDIPETFFDELSRFLAKHGHKDLAIQIARDPAFQFQLALELNDLNKAYSLSQNEADFKRVGELAVRLGDFDVAKDAYTKGNNYGDLLVLYSSMGDVDGVKLVGDKGRGNVRFVANLMTGNVEACIRDLMEEERYTEAAFMARTYAPTLVHEVAQLWKAQLLQRSKTARMGEALADPHDYSQLFDNWDESLKAEQVSKDFYSQAVNASKYPDYKNWNERDVFEVQNGSFLQTTDQATPATETSSEEVADQSETETATTTTTTTTTQEEETTTTSEQEPATSEQLQESPNTKKKANKKNKKKD
jgi:coatomer subunit beta'